VADSLARDFQSTVALVPSYPWISSATPAAPAGLSADNLTLTWAQPKVEGKTTDVVKYVVYRQPDGVDAATAQADASNIVEVVWGNKLTLPAGAKGRYFVTSLNRANNESAPSAAVTVK